MLDEAGLLKLRDAGVKITGGEDVQIIQNAEAFLYGLDMIELAKDLDGVASHYNFKWDRVDWIISDGSKRGSLIEMEYEASIGNKQLLLERRITNESGFRVAHHDYFSIPEQLQRVGLSRMVNGALYKQYKAMEIGTIETYAVFAGGYAWAKAGFAAKDKDELDDIVVKGRREAILSAPVLEALERQIDNHFVQNPYQPFPIWMWGNNPALKDLLIDSIWQGTLNLCNSEQKSRFEEYLNPKP